MTTKITKEDLQQDQIQAELQKGFKWTTKHSKVMIIGVVAFIVVGGSISLWQTIQTSKELDIQEAYYQVERKFIEKQVSLAEAKMQNKGQASGNLETDYGKELSDLKQFVTENAKSTGARLGAVLLVNTYREYKQTDLALEVLSSVAPGLKKGDLTSTLVWSQWGSVLADKNDCEGALQKWESITSQKNIAYAQGETKLRMALCYENLNQLEKAESLYAEVSKSSGAEADFSAAKEAEKYLKLLKAKKNLLSSGS